ncbi:MAG TPA: insulinase family protein [Candidatus Eubacterium faecale]|uniref:Insulinase family protein n=1 Tax=Candidatus Eubacterium faecale TaxID=2838568 RepID=A0A9D2MGW4_9FIRM|nr:insulinase family protein [Candidatus Eubacterium faecale]
MIHESKELRERLYEIDHSSGLKIFVMPKANYKSTYAVFGTKYGSIDTCFKRSDQKEYTRVPEGIAHFLEHKLFESEELDAFTRYAETGASANAFTSFDKTCYLFQCSDRFADSLKILLDFVTHPYFTKETVEKEQGIIGQEITMYYDVPGWMSTFNLLRCLYKNHPVRIDIAGTVESISQITDKLLYDCYHTFYNLNNMALAVVGNVTPEEVIKVCDEMLKKSEDVTIERVFDEEPRDIVKSYEEYHIAVSIPVFSFGYKEACKTPQRTVQETVEMEILLEILAGETSNLYSSLFEKGLINSTFSKEYFTGNGYEAVIFEGESTDAKAVAQAIKEEVARLRKEGISDQAFESARRSLYGREIMSYNVTDDVANAVIGCYFAGYSIFDPLEVYKNVKKEDVEKLLSEKLDEKYSALSVVRSEK